jgi:protein-disulfide isomerase
MKLPAVAIACLLPCLAASLGEVDKAKTWGNPGAPVRIELFSDFQCPGCRGFHVILLPMVMRDFVVPGKAYIFNHEFPLTMHPYSREAANYATAAAAVGKYQQVADVLFREQSVWGTNGKVWDAVASVLTPAEQKKVQALAHDPSILAQVQQDVDSGQAQHIPQTPTLIVSRGAKHYTFPGPDMNNYPLLKSLIDNLLK